MKPQTFDEWLEDKEGIQADADRAKAQFDHFIGIGHYELAEVYHTRLTNLEHVLRGFDDE